jgi:hypothetical protein
MSQGQQAVVVITPIVHCTVSVQKRDHQRPQQASVVSHKRAASNEGGTFQKGDTSTSAANGQSRGRTFCVSKQQNRNKRSIANRAAAVPQRQMRIIPSPPNRSIIKFS